MPLQCSVSESTVSRYEHMIAQLTTQALSQQEEIKQLREALGKTLIPNNSDNNDINKSNNDDNNNSKKKKKNDNDKNEKNDYKSEIERRNEDMYVDVSQETPTNSTAEQIVVLTKSERTRRSRSRKDKKRRMSTGCRRTVEEYTLGLLERYIQHVDERLAFSLVERLRRVTREHVMRTVEKEVGRVLQERQWLQQQQEQEQEEEQYTHNCNVCVHHHHHHNDFHFSPERGNGEKVKSVLRESNFSACMNSTNTTATTSTPSSVVGDSVIVSSQQELKRLVASCDVRSSNIECAQCLTSTTMNCTSEEPNNLVFESSKTTTEPYVSTILVDPSSSDSFTSFHRKHDQHLIEHLQRKVALLEERLYAATVFDQGINNSPPSVEKTCYYAGDGRNSNNTDNNKNSNDNYNSSISSGTKVHRCCSSMSLTNSGSNSSVCDDIEVLMDMFEGRKPPKEVLRLLLGMSN
ncbi:uncharacterized protein TM35_000162260 [Trypanosoma theileri]|uniref:Uncharacterized protein n=1 Tax=Trypanosoma theileri TaxID=67003 RepID=A0A1X0NVM3_9TRYP|nr:uncharacterized protein TM35_000162260 [Trypanosoma theileri]ORC88588.1 hypothetical protein TM35_000162260 [Trypanosoma theileri]